MGRYAIVGRGGRTDRQLVPMAGIDLQNSRGIRKLAHDFSLGPGHYRRLTGRKEVVEIRTQLALAVYDDHDQLGTGRRVLDQPAGKRYRGGHFKK